MQTNNPTRRDAVLAAMALPVVLATAASASAAEMTAVEKSNLQTALEFIKLWGDPAATGAKLAAYLADDCVVITEESKPAARGRAAAEEMFSGYMARGRIDMAVEGTYAFGPVVLIGKRDAFIRDGKPGKANPFAGLFIMRDGKIKEWTEYAAKV